MAIQYKQKCRRCRKNYVTVSRRHRGEIVCFECQKKELNGEIEDPKLKKLLDIPDEFYMKSGFLRSIKINCIRYGSLSDKQIEAFKNTVKKMQDQGSQ